MEEIKKIIDEYKEKGFHVSDELVKHLIWYCKRKMEVAKVENREEYLPLLFKDEIRDYFIRQSVNTRSMITVRERKGLLCVKCAE